MKRLSNVNRLDRKRKKEKMATAAEKTGVSFNIFG